MQMKMGNMEMKMGDSSSDRSQQSGRHFCSQCGAAVKPDDRFCANCGHHLN
jgi:predicted amidophosphoribosyltransferase